ncbi:MAG TPA: response regulator [bacterium]|nr:response regulator [bacterium]
MTDEARRIMVIEADEAIQDLIRESLSDKPCEFIIVDQASEAIVQLAMEGPNLIIMSMEMPDGDGIDLLGNIRDFDDKVPLVVMIGQPTKEKIVAAKKSRAIDILLKPPDMKRLAGRVSNSLWLNPELVKNKKDEEITFEQAAADAAAKLSQDMPREPLEEAIPKGAEVININDSIGGMKLAKTLVWNDVVYGDKGQVLTDKLILQLNRMGVPELCVYTDEELKKKVRQKKKMEAAKPVMGAKTDGGEKVFSKVKRAQVRVQTEEPVKLLRTLEDGTQEEIDGQIADISGGGCALLTAMPLVKGEELLMDFSLDNGTFKMEKIKGIVRHSMKRFGTDDFPQRSGIYFTNITERFRENLITKLFKLERDNKKKENDLRERYGYGPKRRRR